MKNYFVFQEKTHPKMLQNTHDKRRRNRKASTNQYITSSSVRSFKRFERSTWLTLSYRPGSASRGAPGWDPASPWRLERTPARRRSIPSHPISHPISHPNVRHVQVVDGWTTRTSTGKGHLDPSSFRLLFLFKRHSTCRDKWGGGALHVWGRAWLEKLSPKVRVVIGPWESHTPQWTDHLGYSLLGRGGGVTPGAIYVSICMSRCLM